MPLSSLKMALQQQQQQQQLKEQVDLTSTQMPDAKFNSSFRSLRSRYRVERRLKMWFFCPFANRQTNNRQNRLIQISEDHLCVRFLLTWLKILIIAKVSCFGCADMKRALSIAIHSISKSWRLCVFFHHPTSCCTWLRGRNSRHRKPTEGLHKKVIPDKNWAPTPWRRWILI